MPFTVHWHEEQKELVHLVFDGFVTTDELYQGNDFIVDYASRVTHPVFVILDTRHVVQFKANMLAPARDLNRRLPDNVALLVLIWGPQSMFLELMDRILRPTMKRLMKNQRVVSSLEEAFAEIAAYREAVP